MNDHSSSHPDEGTPGGSNRPVHLERDRSADAFALQTVAPRMTRPVQQLLQRWRALQEEVRCARLASDPQRIQHYVLGGAKLARLGVFDEVGVLRHMAGTLLRTARDPVLPALWCRACLEQLAAALKELRLLLGPRGAAEAAAIEDAIRRGDLGALAPC